MKIAIIGAGIAGILPAYYLAKRGHDITIYDQEHYAAMRTSYANGGQISVSNSEVWTTWANVIKGLKWLLKKDAPLLIRPQLDYDQLKWIAKFLHHTASNVYRQNTIDTITLGLESRTLYQEIIDEENINFDHSACGILHIYKSDKYFEPTYEVKELYESHGCSWQILDNEQQLLDIEPNLKYFKNLVGGGWTAEDWVGDIHKFCNELLKVLVSKYSVCVSFNNEINDARQLTSIHDAVIIAAGAETTHLSKLLGDSIAVYPVKGYSITINDCHIDELPKVSLLDDESKIVTSTLGNRFRVAGTAELCGHNRDITRSRIEPLLNWVNENFPHLDTRNYSSWACLRPMTPNMMPIVRESKVKNIYYHTGHGHLGWTISPATSKKLVSLIEK
jgi:D-amino-acid dehydrogenase